MSLEVRDKINKLLRKKKTDKEIYIELGRIYGSSVVLSVTTLDRSAGMPASFHPYSVLMTSAYIGGTCLVFGGLYALLKRRGKPGI
jgi:hypothetical protein